MESSRGNLDDFVLSTSSCRLARNQMRNEISQEVKDQFIMNKPKHVTIHWDGKRFSDEERLAILASGAPNYIEGKLLGVPKVLNGTGRIQADANIELLEAYQISNDIQALVFDTTAANSGVYRGAATLIESEIDSKILYLACRHHIYELLLKAVWEFIFGPSVSPNNTVIFQQQWHTIDTSLPIKLISIPRGFEMKRSEVVLEIRNVLNNKDHLTRDDYRELAGITLLLLGEIVKSYG